jgi:hypothetical protein
MRAFTYLHKHTQTHTHINYYTPQNTICVSAVTVKNDDILALLDKICRHVCAHVTQANHTDLHTPKFHTTIYNARDRHDGEGDSRPRVARVVRTHARQRRPRSCACTM